jgi:two-component sensor histidine kinase
MNINPDSALFYSAKMYHGSNSLHSAQDQMEALQKLIQLSPTEESRRYFSRYRILEDSVQNAWSSARNQFALIRYETEKHKANNLLLQKKAAVRNAWIISLAILLIAGSISGIVWYKRRERHLALKAANAVRESQLKTSKKVHDVVANGLYRLMSEVENVAEFDRERVLDDMEILYERSRDISYDDQEANFNTGDFQNAVSSLLMSFATPETRVVIVGNTGGLWLGVSQDAKDNLYYVLQEFMVNMTKHSEASSVAIRFERKEDNIKVFYTDNGAGLPEDAIFNNGLTNTGNRIRSINGRITFGKGTTGGLNIQIQIPVRQ